MAYDFESQVRKFAEKANMSIGKTIRGSAIVLFRGIIKMSPVDTGRFRANWMVGMKTPSTETTESTDKTGGTTAMNMAQYINAQKDSYEFTMANNLPYAHMLEYGGYNPSLVGPQQSTSKTVNGYSRQAPNGMVRVNVAMFQAILDEQARANR